MGVACFTFLNVAPENLRIQRCSYAISMGLCWWRWPKWWALLSAGPRVSWAAGFSCSL